MRIKEIFLIISLAFISFFISSMVTEAKTYYANPYTPMMEHTILYPGDIIDFSNVYIDSVDRNFYLYLNNERLSNDCFSASDSCLKEYTVVNKMIYVNPSFFNEPKLNFFKLEEDDNLINYFKSGEENYQPGGVVYYKSGDIILFTHSFGGNTNYYIYDENDNLIESKSFDSSYSQIYRLPKINTKDVYWKCEYIIGGAYELLEPHFTPIEYTEPKIELKCDKDEINYGEKTRCEVCLECSSKMRKLNFSINHNNLKLSNISYLDGVTNSSNDNQTINLSFGANSNFLEKRVIMTFDVEGTKDSTYLDNISLGNIEYTDEVVTAKYNNLNSDLNIISTKLLTNPETGVKALFIIMPILLLIFIGLVNIFMNKKKTTN